MNNHQPMLYMQLTKQQQEIVNSINTPVSAKKLSDLTGITAEQIKNNDFYDLVPVKNNKYDKQSVVKAFLVVRQERVKLIASQVE